MHSKGIKNIPILAFNVYLLHINIYMTSKYLHTEETHNSIDPKIIVPIILNGISPKSVVDFGCGIGNFLNEFKSSGVEEILGLDGAWAETDLLWSNVEPHEFQQINLEDRVELNKQFDLAICLEVAEHLPASCSDIIIENLIRSSKIVLFSAAIPGQEGQNHINEQWPDYWISKFKAHGYVVNDVIRPLIWNNSSLHWWYKQNILLFTHPGIAIDVDTFGPSTKVGPNVVHPDLYVKKSRKLDAIQKGEAGIRTYSKLLIKSITRKFRPNK